MPASQTDQQPALQNRVIQAAEDALSRQQYVCAIDVLCGIGWLSPSHVEAWRKGRIDFLERWIQVNPKKLSSALDSFGLWAHQKGLKPSETSYVRSSRNGPEDLQFSLSGDPGIEKRYRTHYISPELPERQQQKLQEKLNKVPDRVVFQIVRDSACSECGAEIVEDSFLTMDGELVLCLPCAGFGDLEFLPSGDTALTRRATKYSQRKAVVVRFSRSRKRYERQGILVEPPAIERAEQECTEDADERAAARVRGAARRREEDRELVVRMIEEIGKLFPGSPPKERTAIAQHAAVRGSGRVGRSAAGRNLKEQALTAAVIAAVRHRHTNYDELLASGVDRTFARQRVADKIDDMLTLWRER